MYKKIIVVVTLALATNLSSFCSQTETLHPLDQAIAREFWQKVTNNGSLTLPNQQILIDFLNKRIAQSDQRTEEELALLDEIIHIDLNATVLSNETDVTTRFVNYFSFYYMNHCVNNLAVALGCHVPQDNLPTAVSNNLEPVTPQELLRRIDTFSDEQISTIKFDSNRQLAQALLDCFTFPQSEFLAQVPTDKKSNWPTSLIS